MEGVEKDENTNGYVYHESKMDKKIFHFTYFRMGNSNYSNSLDCLGNPPRNKKASSDIGAKIMILTKNYFKKFQYGLLVACIFAAAFIGSIQTAFIISQGKKNK